ncbi:hemerythrin domain-containing protein [Daejeonella sp.]|uniref:hemerythrin domain-containing protein n=1 Tax=Daejeonella sp. TaxID=2805397 RepID=UPI003983C059
MKRHIALVPLSREHHGGLILARLLQKGAPLYKGLPTDLQGKAQYAIQFYNDDLIEHFDREEKIVPLVSDVDVQLDELLTNMVEEHKVLHKLFRNLMDQADHADLASRLDVLGKTLEGHIRKEERQLFPLIQEKVVSETMDKVQELLS